jgi:hypothetical protein
VPRVEAAKLPAVQLGMEALANAASAAKVRHRSRGDGDRGAA